MTVPTAKWRALIGQISKETPPVDPVVLEAMVLVESNGDPHARSASDARGLGQLIPKWHATGVGKNVAAHLGKPLTDELWFDPEFSLRAGALHLRWCESECGSWETGVARYHSGQCHPPPDFVDGQGTSTVHHLVKFREALNTVRADLAKSAQSSELISETHSSTASEENSTMATFTTRIPGLPKPVTTSFPIHVRLVPESVPNVRPGIQARTPRRWVQHETGNPVSFAKGENAYLHGGAEGRQVSYHFVGDDTEVYVNIPLNEVTWQAADSGGPGNMNGVSYELCVPTAILSDEARKLRSREIAAEMFGVVAVQLDINEPEQHWNFHPGRKNCPANMRNENFWPKFTEMGLELKARAAGQAVKEAVEEAAALTLDYPKGMDSGIASIAFGKVTGSDGLAYAFNEAGPVSQLWLEEGKRSKQFPQLTNVQVFDTRKYFIFSNGLVIWQPDRDAHVAVLG